MAEVELQTGQPGAGRRVPDAHRGGRCRACAAALDTDVRSLTSTMSAGDALLRDGHAHGYLEQSSRPDSIVLGARATTPPRSDGLAHTASRIRALHGSATRRPHANNCERLERFAGYWICGLTIGPRPRAAVRDARPDRRRGRRDRDDACASADRLRLPRRLVVGGVRLRAHPHRARRAGRPRAGARR